MDRAEEQQIIIDNLYKIEELLKKQNKKLKLDFIKNQLMLEDKDLETIEK